LSSASILFSFLVLAILFSGCVDVAVGATPTKYLVPLFSPVFEITSKSNPDLI